MEFNQLSKEQIELINEYNEIYKKLSNIEKTMDALKKEAVIVKNQLDKLREKDKKYI